MVLLQLKDPLELIFTRREFPPGSGFLSLCDMTYQYAVDGKVNTYSPSLLSLRFESSNYRAMFYKGIQI